MKQLQIDELYGRALYQACRLVLVCGSRTATRAQIGLIRAELSMFPRTTAIIHGDQGRLDDSGRVISGVDKLAGEVAEALGLSVTRYPAQWKVYGPAAGPKRNIEMLEQRPDLVLAFWDGATTGTAGCMREARRRGLPVRVIEFGH